jgi:hypothetical protein
MMPKYNMDGSAADREKRVMKRTIHPVWRGVGFVLIIMVPILSYAATEVLLQANAKSNWFPIPYDLMVKSTDYIQNGDPMLYFKIILTISFMLVMYAVFTMITFVINRLFGAPRYGPLDVPPLNVKVRKHSR